MSDPTVEELLEELQGLVAGVPPEARPAFKPEDADDKWDATERLKYAGRLFSVYNTAANALMVAQEGERRAHGFDYRDQRKAANVDAQDQARRAELMTEIAGLIDIITSKEPEIV